MAESIKFTDKYIDTTGVYDSTLNKTQQVINSKLVTVDTSSSSIGTPNPVNADTFGGYALSNFVRTSQLVNNFTTATAGLYALDAAAGKTLNDSLDTILSRMGDMSFIRSNVYQDYDSKIDGGVFKILYGICDLAGVSYFYISFDVHWVRLQFRTNSTSGLQYRVLYGNSVGNWYTITKS